MKSGASPKRAPPTPKTLWLSHIQTDVRATVCVGVFGKSASFATFILCRRAQILLKRGGIKMRNANTTNQPGY